MTEIKLHNTKTRRKEVFEPIDPQNVRMYLCDEATIKIKLEKRISYRKRLELINSLYPKKLA